MYRRFVVDLETRVLGSQLGRALCAENGKRDNTLINYTSRVGDGAGGNLLKCLALTGTCRRCWFSRLLLGTRFQLGRGRVPPLQERWATLEPRCEVLWRSEPGVGRSPAYFTGGAAISFHLSGKRGGAANFTFQPQLPQASIRGLRFFACGLRT